MPETRLFINAGELISPAGRGVSRHLDSLEAGRCFLRKHGDSIEGRLDSQERDALTGIAGEKELRGQDPLTLLAVLTVRSLLERHRIAVDTGVIFGSSRGPTSSLELAWAQHRQGHRLSPITSPTTTAGSLPAAIAREAGLEGPSLSVSAACSTGIHAIIQAAASIRMGLAASMLAGGAEFANTAFTLAMLQAAKVYCNTSDAHDYPCQPGGADRPGMVLSEGAAVLLIESEAREQTLGELVGWGAATEQATMTGVSANGDGLARAINKALASAQLEPEHIDLIIGHGAGTQKGDAAELVAYERVLLFGVPIVWHKWMMGHMLGASACASAILGLHHLKEGWIPAHPYFPFGHPHRMGQTLQRQRYALITALGFGGNAAALIVKNPALVC